MRVVHRAHTDTERARLRAAAEAARRVRPPGIVRVVSIDETEDDLGAVTLTVVTEEPPLAPPDGELAPASFTALHDALTRLHQLGVAHGEVDRQHLRRDGAGRLVLPLPRWRGPHNATIDDDLARLARLGGPTRYIRPTRATPRRRAPRRAGMVAMAAGALVMGGAALAPAGRSPQPPPPATAPTTSSPRPPTPPRTIPASTDRVVEMEGRRYLVGEEGDLVVIGAWACSTGLTPVVVRPSNGAVLAFDRWGNHVTATPITTLAGVTGAGRATDSNGCHQLIVDTADGPTPVDVTNVTNAGGPPPRSPTTDPAP